MDHDEVGDTWLVRAFVIDSPTTRIKDQSLDVDIKNLTKELGDVLWYISAIASDLDINLETVAQMNVAKLNSRKNRNEIGGSGDNR